MTAPCEAYPQLAWFLREEYIDCVITEDSDLIALRRHMLHVRQVLSATCRRSTVEGGHCEGDVIVVAKTKQDQIVQY